MLFTFQYGSTLIDTCKYNTTILGEFTFQYGSTLICKSIISKVILVLIYIPIWFYFNNFSIKSSAIK